MRVSIALGGLPLLAPLPGPRLSQRLPELLEDVVAGRLDPSPLLDVTMTLDGVPDGYAAMDNREAIKVVLTP